MHNALTHARKAFAALALAPFVALTAHAQNPPSYMEGKTAEQVYKNIQVLQGTPAGELVESMHLIKGALGVECEYCHVSPAATDTPKDDKPTKLTARKMISMVLDINKNSFGGRQVVSCYTCHRGSPAPITVPVLPANVEEEQKPAAGPAMPAIDQILDKYVQALGGEQAIRKITSRVITATQTIPTGPGGSIPIAAQAELYRKAPNLTLNVYRVPAYTISNGFDGANQWAQDLNGVVVDAYQIDTMRAKRAADLFEPLNLKQEYTRMVVRGIEKVNNRDAYAVIALPSGDRAERLYFDVQTGLLLRKYSALPTALGESPFQVDYDDYRDTGSGVKIPYVVRMSPASPRSELQTSVTVQVQKVQDNVAIDDSKFVKPPSKPAPLPAAAPPAASPTR